MNTLFSEMKRMRIAPNVVTYGILINQLCKSGRLDEALQVFGAMTERDSEAKPDVVVCNTIVDGLCKMGRVEEGLRVLGRMRSDYGCEPNVVTFNCLMDGFCRNGELEKAGELVGRMEQEGIKPNVVTLSSLFISFSRSSSFLDDFSSFFLPLFFFFDEPKDSQGSKIALDPIKLIGFSRDASAAKENQAAVLIELGGF